MPECMKVESPMTATVLCSLSGPRILLNPCSAPMEAPMQSVISMAASGATAPSV